MKALTPSFRLHKREFTRTENVCKIRVSSLIMWMVDVLLRERLRSNGFSLTIHTTQPSFSFSSGLVGVWGFPLPVFSHVTTILQS
jgi:hypothetical protein